jgi:hypothetical protein
VKLIIGQNNTTWCRFLAKGLKSKKTFEIVGVAHYKKVKICSVGNIVSQRPSRFDALCRHYRFTPTPLIGSSFLGFQFCLTPVTVADLCGSAFKLALLAGLLGMCGPGSWLDCPNRGFCFL